MGDKIVIEGEMPGMNKIIAAAKAHYGAYAKIKKENTESVAWVAKKIPKKERVYLDITWYCKNKRRDPDNIAAGGMKFICDGLVQAGVIKNDGWSEIKGFKHSFEVDKKNPRVEIIIKEV